MANNKIIREDDFLIFDGAMGTMLQNAGIKVGEVPETYNFLYPEKIITIHEKYIDAGSKVITTNTFGANELKLESTGYSVEEIITEAVNLAKSAKGDKLVALDIGPIGQLLEPMGTISFGRAYDIFKKQIVAGTKAGADLIIIETISDLYEAKAAVLAAKENSHLPVICTMTFEADKRTFTGTNTLSMIALLEGLGVDALGVNCSLGPKELIPVVEEILNNSSIPVIVQANAGLPKIVNDETVYDITPEEYANYIKIMAEKGVRIFGGCCGTDERFIAKIVDELKKTSPKKILEKNNTVICSASQAELLGKGIKVIGERINPTGKKKFKEALKSNNIEYILTEAINQQEAGADILDVNVGLPEIDEEKVMIDVVKEIQSIINLPLQIDSSDPKVIESAVRIYNGKPIINSVNGKAEIMAEIFPIVKKYGACVIGLTLDENGIPDKAEERLKIADKIIKTAAKYGIAKKDIIIDCLVMTASAQQKEVIETIKAIRLVKEQLGVQTSLGVSNVSFGLPNRVLLNKTFLAMAMTEGLDAPIINPNNQEVMDTISAYRLLANEDKDANDYINIHSGQKESSIVIESNNKEINEKTLIDIVVKGLKEEAGLKTKELMKQVDGMKIVKDSLIPALDIVGEKYDKEEIFLPQLIQSAETVKKAFEVIKTGLSEDKNEILNKKKVILATVKGDIHDIGKNIVKLILENYGYEIIDLGKDVSIEKVVEVSKDNNIKAVGLSALMTTTVRSMEDTIKALKENNVDCEVIVGGAVLTEEYAKMINANYYASDPQETVQILKKIFNK